MAGYPYNSTYLLTLFKRLVGRSGIADAVTPATYYDRLTDAQTEIVADIAAIVPHVLYPTVGYGSIPTCVTTDQQTFTFGTDSNGYPTTPLGKVAIYKALNDIPNFPLRAGCDYIPLGGTAIQIPNNGTYSGTLYWRGITPPGVINGSGSAEPVLFPEGARILIAYKAAINFLLEANRNPELAATYMQLYGRPYGGNPGMFAQWCATWRTQFQGGGALQHVTGTMVAVGSSTNMNAGF